MNHLLLRRKKSLRQRRLLIGLVALGTTSLLQAQILVPKGSMGWSMLHITNGVDPAISDADFNTTWFNPTVGGYTGGSYDGPAFTNGLSAPFHYGGVIGLSGGTTLIAPTNGLRYTSYFYKIIDVTNTYTNLTVSLLADDGAFVYLNGVLIAEDSVSGADTFNRLADALGSETSYDTLSLIDAPALNPGTNLLAISLHQRNTTSSDLGFDLELTGMLASEIGINLVRGPYLQSAGHDRMTVRWRTDDPGNSILRFGDATNNLTETIVVPGPTTEHIVTATNLSPATKYYYEIASTNTMGTMSAGAMFDYYFQTHPLPGTRAPARIWIIGDSGTTTPHKYDVYTAYLTNSVGAHTDVWLMLGDNAYNSGTEAEFQAAVFDAYPELLRNTVLWSCIGNHETYTAGGAPYLNIHTFPTTGESGGVASGSERYYSFDHGNIHFISIDSQTSGNYNDTPGGGGMVDWLELDLQATDKDWIIAFFHHGPYTKGSHDSDVESHHIIMRRYVTPLLERYGVDLVLSGHSHCYERSMLINGHHSNMSTADSSSSTFVLSINGLDTGNGSTLGSVNASGTFVTSGADGAYEKPLAEGEQGTVYSICGASGKLSNWTGSSSALINPTPHPVFIVNLRVMGSMILEIDGNTLHAQYIDGANTIRDDFSIVKGSTYQIEAPDNSFAEYGSNSNATLTLSRSGAKSIVESVSYQISGSAVSGTDYSPVLGGSASFAAGATNTQIQLTRMADLLAEGDETIHLSLSADTQAAYPGGAQRARYFLGANTNAVATLEDKPSQDWWFNQFGAATLTEADWKLDTDSDGLNRLQEYAFGGTTGADDSALEPQALATNGNIEIHYTRNNALPDVTYLVEGSTNLTSAWSTNDISTSLDGPANPAGTEQWKGSSPMDESEKFLRLMIEHE